MNSPASHTESPHQPNRLQHETSPYLLQHARNPVDWYPWGEEALAAAREQNKPIFLSIGYSACHWCHVMEHESFESESIAGLMNEHFINIKVDREERPDLDQIYMNAVLAITGRGGWPMSVFLAPDLRPFYGGTYWPPDARMGMPGFRDVLTRVHEAWTSQPEQVLQGAEQLTEAVQQMSVPREEAGEAGLPLLQKAERVLLQSADQTHGGFGGAPKFPHPMDVRLLLRTWRRFGNAEALSTVKFTLDKMARGGIYDHLGGGFHRYATDARWLVPHFEKMLYDNALLTSAYVEAWQATGEELYRRVIRETLDYTLREMTRPGGGFYSTQDADSEGEEGRFFVWSQQEIESLLNAEDARVFGHCYDVSPAGNWEGKNILNLPQPLSTRAEELGLSLDELNAILDRCRKTLLEARGQRVAPGRDDKILVAWNGLMIAAMAQAACALGEPRYITAAREAADFLLDTLREDDGRLLHTFKDDRARLNAYLDDYACLMDGLVDVYQATFEPRYLREAVTLADRMIEQFGDEQGGGFYYTSADHEQLITRQKDTQDNATPSGNGMAAYALLRLGRLTGRSEFEDRSVKTLEMLAGQLQRMSMAGGQSLMALDFLLGPTHELVLVDGPSDDDTIAVLESIHTRFLPNRVIARAPQDSPLSPPAELAPLLAGKTASDNQITLYACQHGACQAPVTGRQQIIEAIGNLE